MLFEKGSVSITLMAHGLVAYSFLNENIWATVFLSPCASLGVQVTQLPLTQAEGHCHLSFSYLPCWLQSNIAWEGGK